MYITQSKVTEKITKISQNFSNSVCLRGYANKNSRFDASVE